LKNFKLGLLVFLTIVFLSSTFLSSTILPHQSRPKLVDTALSVTSDQVQAKNIYVPLLADSDDDYWNFDSSWTHITDSNEVNVRKLPYWGEDFGQFRWSLPIPQYSTIHQATFYGLKNLRESNANAEAIIRRINETNVGPLESDISKPEVVDTHSSTVYFVRSSGWVKSTVTEMIQDQVNLPNWKPDDYFGIQLQMAYELESYNTFVDYQYSAASSAYLNITYSETVAWLDGWNYRKQFVLSTDASAGPNYSIPITVHSDGGTDHDNPISVHTNGFARSDFGDIRFTSSDGVTQLKHRLQSTSNEDPTEYFTDDSVDIAFYTHNYPSAYYFNDRTYVVFQGDLSDSHSLDSHITYYDHENDTWSGIYYVGQNYCPLREEQDNHGAPALWVDNQGYIHVVYGSHNSPLRHTKSDFPEDITSWTHQKYITNTEATYPHIEYDSEKDQVYIIYRVARDIGGWAYRNSTDNGQTWSDEQFPNNKQFYHFAWQRHNYTHYHDENVSYAYFNVSSGLLYNVSGHNLGYSITDDELADCLVFDSPDPSISQIASPNVHVDSNSYPYITYTQYAHGIGSWTSFQYWDGSTWSESEDISTTDWISPMGADFIVHSSNNITAFFTKDADVARYTWDGTEWTFHEKIGFYKERIITFSTVPKNFDNDFQVVFTEYGETMKHKRFSYAWGINGLVKRDTPTQADFWVLINNDLSLEDTVIYIYYNNPEALDSSTTIHTNATVTGYWGLIEKLGTDHGSGIEENDSLDNTGLNITINDDSYNSSESELVYTEFIVVRNENDFIWLSTMILNNLFFGTYIFKKRRKVSKLRVREGKPNLEELFRKNQSN
jgi:hypothetical protein